MLNAWTAGEPRGVRCFTSAARATDIAFRPGERHSLRGMSHVTPPEARIVAEAVHKQVGYLHRLRERMEKGHRKDDPLYAKLTAAHDAVHGLWVHLHCRGCGVDRPPAAAGPNGVSDPDNGGAPAV